MSMTATSPAPVDGQQTRCPHCHALLTGEAVPVPGTRNLKVHTRNEAKLVAGRTSGEDRATDRITAFVGSVPFVYVHTAWFGFWILANAGALGAGLVFDVFPYGLLTMIVSLEAIFLSTFVMISQNRQAARADLRSELDFETNLRSEIWSVHIGRTLGLDPHEIEGHVQEVVGRSQATLQGPAADARDAFDPEES